MITLEQKRKFMTLCKKLNTLLEEIQKTEPEANYYLAADTLNLMKGPSHDNECRALRSNVVVGVVIPNSGGGDW